MTHSNLFNSIFRSTGRLFEIGIAFCGISFAGAVFAQQAMPESTAVTSTFVISGFELTGDVPLSSAETSMVLAPFIGPRRTIADLQRATAALEAAFKARGYGLHRVSLPPQEVGKNVTLEIVKFTVGKVTLEGRSHFSEANIRASIPELREGQSPNFNVLAVQTAIANESSGKQIQVALKESEEPNQIDARVQVKESSMWNLSTSIANTGTEATGRDRVSLIAGHSNLFGLDHQLSLAYTTSLERSNAVNQYGLNYRVPMYGLGAVMGFSYTNSDVVGNFGSFSSTGAGQTWGALVNYYLFPQGGRKSYVSVGLEEKNFNASKINGSSSSGQVDRISRPLTLGYIAQISGDRSFWGYSSEIAANLPGGAGTALSDYISEDPRIKSNNWVLLRGSVNYGIATEAGWIWSVRGQLQYTNEALISGEQFGLGGTGSVRGTAERAVSGDSGALLTTELTTPEVLSGLRLLSFLDAGWLASNNTDLNPNKAANDRLASVGLGMRYAATSWSLSMEWGRVSIGAVQLPLGAVGIPKNGDEKLHVNLTARF